MLPRTLVTTLATVPWLGPRLLFRLHDRGLGFDTVTWPDFVEAVRREQPREVSVDVFDTCLVRDLAGHRAIEEAILHRRATIDGPTDEGVDHAESMEREVSRPVPGAREALEGIRAVVGSITFVSDTDRSSALLVELLTTHGLFVDGDRLFASCEEGATKSNGDLFARIWPKADGEAVWHLGNHPWSDGTMAAATGLRPFHLPEADLDRYEVIMARSVGGQGPAVAGAARRARLNVVARRRSGELSESVARATLVGAGVGGQALSAFNLWLGHQADTFELSSLGFLARDGELPLRMARSMPADHWGDVSLRYLHCSRLSWGLASASAVGVQAWLQAGQADDGAFLLAHRHDVPVSTLLTRIGLSVADLNMLGTVHGRLAARPMDGSLPQEAADEWDRLLADDRVAEIVLERSEARRKLVVDYLAGEGMMEGRVGMVDVGWRGRLAWHISSVMRAAGVAEPVHLHFGGDKVIAEVDETTTIVRFAFQGNDTDPVLPEAETITSPVACVETLTAAGKPRVVDYRRLDDGSVDLVFSAAGSGQDPDDGDRSDLWAGALTVAALLPTRRQLDKWGVQHTDLGRDVQRVLARWWNRPTNEEVNSIAHLRFEHDEAGTSYHPLAEPYSWEEVARRTGSRRGWVNGSEVMTPWSIRLAVSAGRLIKDTVARIRR